MIGSELMSNDFLHLNCCGTNKIFKKTCGSRRMKGRPDFHILYIVSGICRLKLDDNFIPVGEGNIILFRPGEKQEYYFKASDKSVSYYIHFSGKECETILKELGIYDIRVFCMGKSSEFEDVFQKMQLEDSLKKKFSTQVCSCYLLKLLTLIARRHELSQASIDTNNEKRIEKALSFIYNHLSENLTVEELAKECCMSAGHFSHVFKETLGVPPMTHINFLRIEKAKNMLMNTSLSIKEIGFESGFTDQNYFSRMFKKTTGLSPCEYRNSL